MQKLTAAVVQMVSGPDLKNNLAQAETLLKQAKRKRAQLVMLPENFAYMGYQPLTDVAEGNGRKNPVNEFLAKQSKALGLWIIGGTVPSAESASGVAAPEGKVFSTNSVWNPDGEKVAAYDKCHLFDVTVADGVGSYRESDSFVAGDEPKSVTTPWGEMILSICYDLRFPEYYRRLINPKTTLISVPSAFTYRTGEAHWDVLLRARAIENQCFLMAANQGGDHGNRRITYGHSCIISPWGEVLAVRSEPGPGLAIATFDLGELKTLRANMPVLSHRRF